MKSTSISLLFSFILGCTDQSTSSSQHEASPGHHFQGTIQQEITDLPMFRRFGGYTVYSEGWALYAESLGKELGLFTDPMMWYGRLVD